MATLVLRYCLVLFYGAMSANVNAATRITHRVDCEPPRIEYQTFEPGHPPPILQRAPGEEAAFCGTRFEILVRLEAETPRFTAGLGSVKIKLIDLTTRCVITVWTPEGGLPEYLAHEETHRAISEHYYANARAVAERIATRYYGLKLDLPARKNQALLDLKLHDAQEEIIREYTRGMNDRCDFAQDRFDTITDHGRDPVANDAAMKQAIADEEAHWAETNNASAE